MTTSPAAVTGRVATLGPHILDVLGRPVDAIPAGQGSVRLAEIRATAAGAAVDLAKLVASVTSFGVAVDVLHPGSERDFAKIAAALGGADWFWPNEVGGELAHIPAIEVPVVDTTGCGDGFNAGVLTGLMLGCDRIDAAWLGVACGSLVATGLGSDAGIRGLGHVLRFLRAANAEVAERIAAHVAAAAKGERVA
jgi:hypothetical protein